MDFLALAQQCAPAIHPQTLAAIVKTESAFNPFAIGVNKGILQLSRQPRTKEEAVATAKALIESGKNIDMGLGQINSENLARLGFTVDDVFDVCKNLSAAASILTDNYTRASAKEAAPQQALRKALSAYNTGNFVNGIQNGYVQRVSANGQKIAQGYVVPAIKADPQAQPSAAPNDSAKPNDNPLVVKATKPDRTRAAQKPAAPVTDPALVFGNPPHHGDDEAQAMVF